MKGRDTMSLKHVVIAGTFDVLHPGHVFLISEAAKQGLVTVVVARDENVMRAKGRSVVIPEDQRLFMVQALKGVSKAVLGNFGTDFLKIIEELHPDLLMLGPDQRISLQETQNELQARGLKTKVLRLEKMYNEYPLSSTTDIIERIYAIRKGEP